MTGHLQIKNGKYYAVINYYKDNKRFQKWLSSGLEIKGNKGKAEKFLREQLSLYENEQDVVNSDILFCEFVKVWLKKVVISVDEVTYQGYKSLADTHIIPYFEKEKILLKDVRIEDLQKYVNEKAQNGRLDGKGGLSSKSLKLHRNILNQTLKEAVREGLIKTNPCTYVKFPQVQNREPTFYTATQVDKLLSCIDDKVFNLLISITATYGLRRSEVLGLKWSSIDFVNDTLLIAHTVVKINTTVRKNKTKNKSSFRKFPLIPEIKDRLYELKALQEKNKKELKKAYIESDYIFVWSDGKPFATEYVSQHFRRILKWNDLPRIRFHDLRHSCASILLSRGFTLKDVQEWLGHSDITLTANIYGHLDIERKRSIANSFSKVS